ncbi:MAG: hypothetical protein COA68_12345 [Oceanobacter sp.]|nr:MAG: hypothetical protein COA68_12345 [Oceanobacter sp.]
MSDEPGSVGHVGRELIWSILVDIATGIIADELLQLTGDKAEWATLHATLKKQGDEDNNEALVMLRSMSRFEKQVSQVSGGGTTHGSAKVTPIKRNRSESPEAAQGNKCCFRCGEKTHLAKDCTSATKLPEHIQKMMKRNSFAQFKKKK